MRKPGVEVGKHSIGWSVRRDKGVGDPKYFDLKKRNT